MSNKAKKKAPRRRRPVPRPSLPELTPKAPRRVTIDTITADLATLKNSIADLL